MSKNLKPGLRSKNSKPVRKENSDQPKNEEEVCKSSIDFFSDPPQQRSKIIKKKNSQKAKSTIKPKDFRPSENFLCSQHNSKIEWICMNPLCFSEICGHCMLKHQHHISSIKSLKEVFSNMINSSTLSSLQKMRSEIISTQKSNLAKIEDFSSRIKDIVSQRISFIREEIVSNDNRLLSTLDELENLNNMLRSPESDVINNRNFASLKSYLKFDYMYSDQNFCPFLTLFKTDYKSLKINFKESFKNNAVVLKDGLFLESTHPQCPKILHWFEWGRKRLNVYDIVRNVTEMIDLDIEFKIPSFSRSIVLPTAQIFIMGGEEPEFYSKKEVYMYDYVINDKKLVARAPMPSKKFDFTLCYSNKYIYVLCGKDASSEVVDSCEKYGVDTNVWTTIAPANRKRYAASATGVNNRKIFLFGGRSDINNAMVEEIEEYDQIKNVWKVITLANVEMWNPVEVCACIQIKYDEILIFGGSDKSIKDSERCFVLDLKDYSLRRTKDLKRAQVFVSSPFLYGSRVYAIGNEYYMKSRNLHCFSLDSQDWNIIFQKFLNKTYLYVSNNKTKICLQFFSCWICVNMDCTRHS